MTWCERASEKANSLDGKDDNYVKVVVVFATSFLDSGAGHLRISALVQDCLFDASLFQHWTEIMVLFESVEESLLQRFLTLYTMRTEKIPSPLVHSSYFPHTLLQTRASVGNASLHSYILHVFVSYTSALYVIITLNTDTARELKFGLVHKSSSDFMST